MWQTQPPFFQCSLLSRLILFATALVVSDWGGPGVTFAAPQAEPIRSIAEVLQLVPQQVEERPAVDIEATVYYQDNKGHFFFLGQAGEYLVAEGGGGQLFPPGTKVRLRGVISQGRLKPICFANSIEVISENDQLDTPQELELDRIEIGDTNMVSRWARMMGVVEHVRLEDRRTVLGCRQGNSVFTVCYPKATTPLEAAEYIGARVGVTGNVGSQVVGEQIVGVEIYSPVGFLEITQPPNQQFRLGSPSTVAELWDEKDPTDFILSGQVTYAKNEGFFVETHESGVWIKNPYSNLPVTVGSNVDVYGSKNGHGKSMCVVMLANNGETALSEPRLATVDELFFAERPESRRTKVRGQLSAVQSMDKKVVLSMKADNARFEVRFDASEDQVASLDLDSVLELQATGTCSFYSENKLIDFVIYVPDVSDIQVIRRNASFGSGEVLTIVAGIGSLLVACLLWSVFLRNQVNRKNGDIDQLTAELQSSYESIRDGIIIVGPQKKILHANKKAREFFGLPLKHGMDATSFGQTLSSHLESPEFVAAFDRLNEDQLATRELAIELGGTVRRSLEVFSSPVNNNDGGFLGRLWAFYDVTEREELQASLLQSQKQEAIGRLAGGIAHDFNNLLTGIMGSLQVMQLEPGKTVEEVREYIDTATGASERAAVLVSQILGFSRKAQLDLQTQNVNDILIRLEPLLRPTIKGELLRFELGEVPLVRADDTQLEQLLLNIFLNANDAIGSGGEIVVKTLGTQIEQKTPSHYAVISIHDSGSGMTAEVREKIFDPFFTTKSAEGTGLGLSVSEGIIHQHGGWIECDSVLGVGTEFRIYLPATSQPRTVPVTRPSVGSTLDRRNSAVEIRTILIVDDEEVVRATTSKLLKAHGFRVQTAASGTQAISILKTTNNIDCVILDWTMPGVDGKATLKAIKRICPNLPTIVYSGYLFDCSEVDRQANITPDAVLQKPFSAREITGLIDKVLV